MSQEVSPNTQILQRVPPNDAEAELAVLGSVLLDSQCLPTVFEHITAEDFYRPDYRAVFEAIISLFSESMPVDFVTLKNKLEEKGLYDTIGGLQALTAIATSMSTSANIRYHCKIVADKSVLRRLIRASAEISGYCYEGAQSVNYILEAAEKSVFDISQKRNTEGYSHIKDVLAGSIEKIEKVYMTGAKVTGVPTGFSMFDYMTAGLQPSDLILIAARPSMGKTALELNIAQNAAIKHGYETAIFSLEMSKEQLVNRLLCCEAMIDAQKLRTGDLSQEDWIRIAEATGTLAKAPIFIDDTPGITIAELRSKCRKIKLEKGLGLIMIDYIQLMNGSGRSDSRQQEISEISRSLKALAREMNVPVVALSQLSRACEQRADHRPMLSDLRESGAIEQDADVVSFIYREERYNPDTDKKNMAELIIAKQRNGPVGTVDLMYLGQYTKFADMDTTYAR